jgi:hypothetical protein
MQVYADRNALITMILEELKVVAYGQPASSIEIDAVSSDLDGAALELNARNISPVMDLNSIPIEYLNALAQCVARMFGNKFSLTAEETDSMFGKETDVLSPENRMRAMKNSRAAYVPMTPDYF